MHKNNHIEYENCVFYKDLPHFLIPFSGRKAYIALLSNLLQVVWECGKVSAFQTQTGDTNDPAVYKFCIDRRLEIGKMQGFCLLHSNDPCVGGLSCVICKSC